jgi:UDP-3-O-[3-hydroxymyristoyl] glucosamine N-acyltransferase
VFCRFGFLISSKILIFLLNIVFQSAGEPMRENNNNNNLLEDQTSVRSDEAPNVGPRVCMMKHALLGQSYHIPRGAVIGEYGSMVG